MESEGTKKMIEIAGPLVDAIISGKILVVDELDAKLHPFLTRKIIGLFMDNEINRSLLAIYNGFSPPSNILHIQ